MGGARRRGAGGASAPRRRRARGLGRGDRCRGGHGLGRSHRDRIGLRGRHRGDLPRGRRPHARGGGRAPARRARPPGRALAPALGADRGARAVERGRGDGGQEVGVRPGRWRAGHPQAAGALALRLQPPRRRDRGRGPSARRLPDGARRCGGRRPPHDGPAHPRDLVHRIGDDRPCDRSCRRGELHGPAARARGQQPRHRHARCGRRGDGREPGRRHGEAERPVVRGPREGARSDCPP